MRGLDVAIETNTKNTIDVNTSHTIYETDF